MFGYRQLYGYYKKHGPPSLVGKSVMDYGAVGDGVKDDTAAIQAAIDTAPAGGTVYFPSGKYKVRVPSEYQGALTLKDNINLHIDSGATIQLTPNSYKEYSVLNCRLCNNIKIFGRGTIRGDRDQHLGSSGEWGHGINISGATNITVEGVTIENCWGDGIFIGDAYGGPNFSQGITVSNFNISNCRRNGISIVSGKQVTIEDGTVSNIYGTDPQCGIDIEPDDPSMFLQDIVIRNVTATGCAHLGLLFALGYYETTTNPTNILVDNFDGSGNYERYNFYYMNLGKLAVYVDYKRFLNNPNISIKITNADYIPSQAQSVKNAAYRYDNIDWWEGWNGKVSLKNGVVSITGDGTSPYVNALNYTSTPAIVDHLVYIRTKAKVTNSVCDSIMLGIGGDSSYDVNAVHVAHVNSPVQNREYTLSGIYRIQSNSKGDLVLYLGRHNYSSSRVANGKVEQIWDAGAVDLTAVFGEGKEPDTVWCDANLVF